MSIFISIASYCDVLLSQTISSALRNADHPDDITFGIVDQNFERTIIDEPLMHPTHMNYVFIHYKETLGLGWARTLASSFYDEEDWYLQIDSHMIFDKSWDTILIQQATHAQKFNSKCILSSFPPKFEISGTGLIKYPTKGKILAHVLTRGQTLDGEHSLLRYEGKHFNSQRLILGAHVAGGCIFARGDLFLEMPYDPFMYFSEEEQAIAIRSYTHGWDIFHITDNPIYHLYNTEDGKKGAENGRPMHWNKDHSDKRNFPWQVLCKKSKIRLDALVCGKEDLKVYGLGKQRTMQDYAEFSGVDYVHRKINGKAYIGHWL
ncbi:hypothetical protein KSF73_08205 [Burkholderiaceae bacterium DAT-1]|nr:hypothetical protein [Burkholderiaceae bacterium DAT-1]